jgi:hypothetical protein
MYHLVINQQTISSDTLMKILLRLPEVVLLKLSALLLSSSQDLFNEEKKVNRFQWVLVTNKIRKVYLEEIHGIDEVYYFMKICPHTNYLQVNSIRNIDIESFIQSILTRMNEDLRIPTADNQLIEKLKEMIDSKQWLVDYTIKCVIDKIYNTGHNFSDDFVLHVILL